MVGGNLLEVIRPTEKGNKKFASISGDNFPKFYERITVMRPEEIAAEFSLPQDAAAEGSDCDGALQGADGEFWSGHRLASGLQPLSDGLAYRYGVKKHYIQKGHNFDEDILAAARTISKRYEC